jgi:ABC-type uncharacterized transport system fused permease/ATPase subunit
MNKKFQLASNNSGTYLSVDNLTINTPSGREIVKDLSFSVTDGTKLAIIGSEGTGKSTLLKIIAGVNSSEYNISGNIFRGRIGYLRIHPG